MHALIRVVIGGFVTLTSVIWSDPPAAAPRPGGPGPAVGTRSQYFNLSHSELSETGRLRVGHWRAAVAASGPPCKAQGGAGPV